MLQGILLRVSCRHTCCYETGLLTVSFSLYCGIRLTGDKPRCMKAYLLSLHSIGLFFVRIKSSLNSSGAYLHP
ncbi:hypothetical protein DYJ25_08660 [Prevotella denticola]|nr:hypothetical protein DYJ25_08660 [Prevotella denticola]